MKNSSNRNYCEKFQTYMYDQQKFNLNFKSSNTEECNNLFNLVELKEAINKSHDTASGPINCYSALSNAQTSTP